MALTFDQYQYVGGAIIGICLVALIIISIKTRKKKKKEAQQMGLFGKKQEAPVIPPPPQAPLQAAQDNYVREQELKNTLFPNIRNTMQGPTPTQEEIDHRLSALANIAQRIKQEQENMSIQSDMVLDKLDIYVQKMDNIRNQYVELADIIETQFQIVEFELEAKNRILQYHNKNKQRRKGLPQEIEAEKQKAAQTEAQTNEINTLPNVPPQQA